MVSDKNKFFVLVIYTIYNTGTDPENSERGAEKFLAQAQPDIASYPHTMTGILELIKQCQSN